MGLVYAAFALGGIVLATICLTGLILLLKEHGWRGQ